MRYFYTYKITNIETEEFYIGRHSTKKLNDGYGGSGNWILKSRGSGALLEKEIIKFYSSSEDLVAAEQCLLDNYFGSSGCKNENPIASGWNDSNHPSNNPQWRTRRSLAWAGDNNPSKKRDLSGANNPRFGKLVSEETRKKLKLANLGKRHSQETKEKCRQNMMGREITWRDKISKSLKGKSKKISPRFEYIIKTPTGEQITSNNLHQFCIANDLYQGRMVATLKCGSHKGYKLLSKQKLQEQLTTPGDIYAPSSFVFR